jgi:hypothetical protein
MKNKILILFACAAMIMLYTTEVTAQTSEWHSYNRSDRNTQTLLNRNTSYGGFGSWMYGATNINGQTAYLTGRKFMFVMNVRPQHTLNIGFSSYRTQSDFDVVNWDSALNVAAPQLETEYSGFELEYVNRSRRLVHFGGQLLVGSGEVKYTNSNILLERRKDSYFVMQPGINMHLNVTTWLRLNAGVYYRYASNVNLQGTSDADLSGFSAVAGFRIGAF